MGDKFCQECDKKINNTCKKICKALEEYLNQDVEVNRREEYLTEMEEHHLNGSNKWGNTLSTPYAIISIYFIEHKAPKEIAKMLRVSKQYVYKTIKKHKNILKENIRKMV